MAHMATGLAAGPDGSVVRISAIAGAAVTGSRRTLLPHASDDSPEHARRACRGRSVELAKQAAAGHGSTGARNRVGRLLSCGIHTGGAWRNGVVGRAQSR